MAHLLLPMILAWAVAPPPAGERPEAIPLVGCAGRALGPTEVGGRIPALAVDEGDPRIQYVGSAAGGLWKTRDGGRSWNCVFSGRPHASIGAVSLAPSDARVVWVGTGEANPRNSVRWGNGVWLSRDAGATWTHAGLAESRHIGKIAVHPTDPEVAYVAALGHLWQAGGERGLFRTSDGGKSWRQVLKLDADTGCVDVVIDPMEPRRVYAAAYAVRRGPFSGGNPRDQFGPRAGIYRSDDGGETW